MKMLAIAALLASSIASAAGATTARKFSCQVADPKGTMATKHLKQFQLQAGTGQITLGSFSWLYKHDGIGCGQRPPSRPVSITKVKNAAKTPLLKNWDEYQAKMDSPLRSTTCFSSFNVYLPPKALSQSSYQLRITWSDTDGGYPTDRDGHYVAGGDVFNCR